MTPEEKAEEKTRLQGLVKNFANKAVQGVRCSFVDADTGAVSPATYLVDKSLSQFTVKSDGGRKESCRLSQIQDVHSIEFGNELLPADVLAKLDEESKQRLVMVRHRCEGEGAGRLCVLESTAAEKVKFHTCMRILRLYSQQSSQPATAPSAPGPEDGSGATTVVEGR